MDFLKYPCSTRSRLSLFHQSIHIYQIIKCVMANAIMSIQEIGGDPKVTSILQDIRREIQEIHMSQKYGTVRLGCIDSQLKTMHQMDKPGSNGKDPVLIESLDD